MKTVMVTGGAGYIGSHCAKAFASDGWRVVCVDNLSRGSRDSVRWGPLIKADVTDRAIMTKTIQKFRPDVIAHFAAYAYVRESTENPQIYYDNNVAKTLSLFDTVLSASPKTPVLFSSSCATFGNPITKLIDESHPQHPINPYGWSKLMVERILQDYAQAYSLSSISLRYFNAAGGDPEGEIGERHDPETHAIPLALRSAITGKHFEIFGGDFNTPDGSAVRDYIHVMDLADAHVRAARRLLTMTGNAEAYNIGSGCGVSVFELVEAVKAVAGKPLQIVLAPRRYGDPATLVADPTKAGKLLGWSAQMSSIETIIEHALIWQKRSNIGKA